METFPFDRSTLSQWFKPRPRVIRTRKEVQLFNNLSKDGIRRGTQRNSFYHRLVDARNKLPKKVAESKMIDDFIIDLDYGVTASGSSGNPIYFIIIIITSRVNILGKNFALKMVCLFLSRFFGKIWWKIQGKFNNLKFWDI